MASRRLPAAFDRLLDRLLAIPDGDFLMLTRRQVPRPPTHIDLPNMILDKGFHDYQDYRVDQVCLHASPRTLARLALLVLADVLHPSQAGVELHLTHVRSTIRRWRLRSGGGGSSLGLNQLPVSYGYAPEEPAYHPWTHLRGASLPHFALTNAAECIGSEAERAARDTLVGCGEPEASARFAALLLDLGHPGHARNEVALEGEAGFGSLAPASTELTIWMPGSVGWQGADDEPPMVSAAAKRRATALPRHRSRR